MIFSSQLGLNDKVQNDCGRHVEKLLVINIINSSRTKLCYLPKQAMADNENSTYTAIQRQAPPHPTSNLYSCPLSQIGELFLLHPVYNDFFIICLYYHCTLSIINSFKNELFIFSSDCWPF